jgi:hypothetical protein
MQYDWKTRFEAVSKVETSMHDHIGLGNDEEVEDLRRLCGTIISCLRLYAARPLQRHPAMRVPKNPDIDIMSLAAETINNSLHLFRETHLWSWYGRQFDNWHPLAVLLAELSVCDADNSTAWQTAEQAYHGLKHTIADGPKGSLWMQITKLYHAARSKHAQQQRIPAEQDFAVHLGEKGEGTRTEISQQDLTLGHAETVVGYGPESWACWEAFIDDIAGTDSRA